MITSDEIAPSTCRRLLVLAERDPRRAVPLARRAHARVPADDTLALGWVTYTLGYALLCWERFDEARDRLRDAAALFESHDVLPLVLRCRAALLRADLLQFARPTLEAELAELVGACLQLGLPLDAARVELDLLRLFNGQGRPREAEGAIARATQLLADSTTVETTRLMWMQGVTAILKGDYARASQQLLDAETLFLAEMYRREAAWCRADLAWCLSRQEYLPTALAHYQHAERIFIKLDLPLRLAFCAKNIGLLYIKLGRYAEALAHTLRAQDRFKMFARADAVAECQLHLGNVFFYTQRWEVALAYYTLAETAYRALGALGYAMITQRNRAMVYREQGRRADAQALLAEVEMQARQRGDQTELAEIWNVQASLLSDAGLDEAATKRYQQAYNVFVQLDSAPAAAECMLEIGWLALKRARWEEARAAFVAASPDLARLPHHLWRVMYGRALCDQARGDDIAALTHYLEANNIVGSLRRRLANETISGSLSRQASQLYIDALNCAARAGAAATLLELGEAQRALVLLRLLYDPAAPLPSGSQADHDRLRVEISALLAQRRPSTPEHGQVLNTALSAYSELLLHARHSSLQREEVEDRVLAAHFDLEQVRARLTARHGTEWTVLVYSFAGDTLLITSVTPDGLALSHTPADKTLQNLIERTVQKRYRRMTYHDLEALETESPRTWPVLQQLAARLLPADMLSRLHPQHRLLIIPAGPLHGIPWSALRFGDHWLAEQAVVQLAPSLAIWQTLDDRPSSNNTAALLIGCRKFGARASELPQAVEELATVAQYWPGPCDQLVDEQATRAAVLERGANGNLRSYRLLHIATHAQLMPAHGFAAHLKLWDDDVWLAEVASLGLDTDLVLLSACEGAAADVQPGDEVLSLSWAFLAAGSRGVLASLWEVHDQAVQPLLAAFAETLPTRGDAALALALAQRAIIAQHVATGSQETLPEYWSGFVAIGATP